jgi:hypothetical protein
MHISAYKMRMLKVQRASAQTPPPGAKQPRLEPQSTQSEVLLSEFKPPPLEAAARHGLDRVRRVESPNLKYLKQGGYRAKVDLLSLPYGLPRSLLLEARAVLRHA